MKLLLKILFLYNCCSIVIAENEKYDVAVMKEYVPAGKIEALVDMNLDNNWKLVQLDLKNDSLLSLVNNILPEIEFYTGPGSYHRVMHFNHLEKVKDVLTNNFYFVIDENYNLLNSNREFWIDVKQGSETHGTWSEDEAIEYTCSCLSGASNCVKLGWDESWYNPFDYWGEAWYGYTPPYYQSIDEIRVVVRGGQCDVLPTWSETYMGMMDNNESWSQDYQLSIDYTDNEFIVSNVWNGSMLMPRIGSEDNYCIDTIRLKFYYNCENPISPSDFVASDGSDCNMINLNWLPSNTDESQQILYKDNNIIAELDFQTSNYNDWSAEIGLEHTYCIETVNECGSSTMICDQGSLALYPEPANNVSASDGEYADVVLLNWSISNNVEQYKIYRDNSWIGFVDGEVNEYTDIIPELDIIYNYCLEAINDCGESDFSCDTGYISATYGDINLDGTINILDVVLVVNIIIETYQPSEQELLSSDINNDGSVDILDIVILTSFILEN